jgi:hypothetical protein
VLDIEDCQASVTSCYYSKGGGRKEGRRSRETLPPDNTIGSRPSHDNGLFHPKIKIKTEEMKKAERENVKPKLKLQYFVA